jgi:hypothetical protein
MGAVKIFFNPLNSQACRLKRTRLVRTLRRLLHVGVTITMV